MGTVTPCSWRQKSDCALSLTSTERNGVRWAGEAGEGCTQRSTTRRGGEQGDGLGRQPRKSTAGKEGGTRGQAGSQDDGKGGCLWMHSAGWRESWELRERAGRMDLLFLANRTALGGIGSHSGHLPNTCAVRKILIHDVGDN